MKLAVAVQRYGADINGGAELHARYVAEQLARHARGRGRDDVRERLRHVAERAPRRRRDRQRRPRAALPGGRTSATRTSSDDVASACSSAQHSIATSSVARRAKGRRAAALIDYIAAHAARVRLLHLLQLSLLPRVSRRARGSRRRRSSCRPPNGTRAIGLSIFGPMFRGVRAHHVQLARRARDDPGRVRQPASPRRRRRRRLGSAGRTRPRRASGSSSASTGRSRSTSAASTRTRAASELFELLPALRRDVSARAGPGADRQARSCRFPIIRASIISASSTISDKFDALAAADLLIMPSYFESLSMVALEAWALGKPVLANGRCDVLKGQCIRSSGGPVLRELRGVRRDALRARVRTDRCTPRLGRNGREYFARHYAWPVIERKYLRHARAAAARRRRQPRRPIEPLPGWFAGGAGTPPAARRARRRCRRARCPSGRGGPRSPHDRERTARRAFIRCWRRSATAMPSATRCSASSACCARAGYSRRSSSRPPTRGSKT